MALTLLGVLLLAAGIVVLIGRRRIRVNLGRAGLIREDSKMSAVYVFSIAGTQILGSSHSRV